MSPILTVCRDLQRLGCRWAVVGGHAVSARSVPRFTKDLDVSVSVGSDREAETLVRGLHGLGYRVRQLLEHEPTGRLATVRLVLPGSRSVDPELDLLFASSGIEAEVVAMAEVLEIESGVRVPVATRGHLLALKVLAANAETRPMDIADIRALLVRASDDEVATARQALDLIAARGFARGKDLQADFQAFLGAAGRG